MSARDGFRIDTSRLREKLKRIKLGITAEQFRPELLNFARKGLQRAAERTPVRSLSLIRSNQKRQFYNRTHYIPSVHTTEDPTLIVKEDGTHMVFAGGKWYCATYRTLPPEVEGKYFELLSELQRRLETSESEFIQERAQARFLYRRSVYEQARSLGLSIGISAAVAASHSRHNPPKDPPKGYAQWRGGKVVLSVVFFSPLSRLPSRFMRFDAAAILGESMRKFRPAFDQAVRKKLRTLLARN